MLKESSEFDVAIVGASLSGAYTAYLLGRSGYRVALIDPQQFPRRKPCGEGLSSLGFEYLKRSGLWNSELDSATCPFFGYDIYPLEGQSVSLRSESQVPQGYGISRVYLDALVNRAAASLNSVTLIRQRVTGLSRQQRRWVVTTSGGSVLQSTHAVLACGAGAAKLIDTPLYYRSENPRYGAALWCEGLWKSGRPERVQIHHRAEGQYIITPIAENRINISVLLDKRKGCRRDRLSSSEIRATACEIAESAGFSIAITSKVLGAPAIQSVRLRSFPVDIFLVGDAVERLDPIGGMGMTHALFSAALAVRSIMHAGEDAHACAASYYRAREKGIRPLRLLTRSALRLNSPEQSIVRRIGAFSPRCTLGMMHLLKSFLPMPALPSGIAEEEQGASNVWENHFMEELRINNLLEEAR